MQAVRKQATDPDMKARKTTPAKSDFRSGAMDDSVASWTPGGQDQHESSLLADDEKVKIN